MRNILLTSLIAIGMFCNSVAVMADEVKSGSQQECTSDIKINCTVNTGNTTVTTNTNLPAGTVSNLPISGNTTTTTTYNMGSGGSGAYAQAQEAKSQANTTMLLGIALAVAFGMQCGPHNPTACMLAAAAAAAAAMAAGKKAEAGKLMKELGTGEDSSTSDTQTTTDGGNNAEGQLAQINSDLANKGYKVNTNGSVTLPNGSTVDPSMSESSLQAAGLSNSDVSGIRAGLDKMRKDINDKLGKDEGQLNVASVDANAMSGAYGSTPETGKGTPTAGADRMPLDRNPAAWDGFYKQYGDSLIGVGNSDIFMMVEKRVQVERKLMGQ